MLEARSILCVETDNAELRYLDQSCHHVEQSITMSCHWDRQWLNQQNGGLEHGCSQKPKCPLSKGVVALTEMPGYQRKIPMQVRLNFPWLVWRRERVHSGRALRGHSVYCICNFVRYASQRRKMIAELVKSPASWWERSVGCAKMELRYCRGCRKLSFPRCSQDYVVGSTNKATQESVIFDLGIQLVSCQLAIIFIRPRNW